MTINCSGIRKNEIEITKPWLSETFTGFTATLTTKGKELQRSSVSDEVSTNQNLE